MSNFFKEVFELPFPVFDLGDFVLRELSTRDAREYFSYMTHKEVAKYIATTNLPSSVQHAAMELQYWSSLFKLKRGYYWGIELKKDNKLIGTIGYNMLIFTHMRAEISYDLSFDHWGQGIMSRSLEKVLEFSYSVLKLVRLQATTVVDNYKSAALLERCGFIKEGVLAKYEYLHGVYCNSIMYAKVSKSD